MRAVYPGSFDPVTLGHLDLIERGSRLCSHLIVGVIDNPRKKTLFSLEERCQLLQQQVAHLSRVSVEYFSGLLVDFLRQQGATAVLRGLRDSSDCSGEIQMARLNRDMYPDCDTLWLAASGRHAHISSSFVREIAHLGGPLHSLVHPDVEAALKSRLKRSETS